MIKKYKEDEIDKLADILMRDGVIAIPTDTVYGLCVRMDSKKAREKLMRIKNRPSSKSLPVMCADINQIKSIARIEEREEKIIQAFMPGPITLILVKGSDLPEYVNEGSIEIGVRMATSKVLEELIKKIGSPICVSSANKSGEPTCTTIDEISRTFPDLDGILEGEVIYGESSTIINCTLKDKLIIQRKGPISLEQIEDVLDLK